MPAPWRVALGAVGTVGLLAALGWNVRWARVGALFLDLDPGWVSLGLLLYVALQCVRALRYRQLAPEASARVLVGVHFVHVLLLRVMPLRTGELGFAWLMRRHGAGGFTRNLVGVLLLRVLDLATVFVVFAIGLVLFGATLGERSPSVAPALAIGLVALLAPLYLRYVLRLGHRAVEGFVRLARLDRVVRLRRARSALSDAVGWSAGLPSPVLWKLTGLTFVQWAVNFVLVGVLLAAMHVPATVPQTVLGGTGTVLGGLLPLAGIGNFGPLEAGWSLGFAAVGIEPELAIASAFGFSVLSFSYAIGTAVVGWLVLPRSNASS